MSDPNVRALLRLLVFSTLTLAMGGCADNGESPSYRFVVEDRKGVDYTFEGDKPSCKVNTSFPTGDPKRGKFFVGVFQEVNGNILSLYIHFLDYTAAPPAGTYSNSDPKVDVSFSTDFADDEVDVADNERDLSNVSVIVSDDGNGIRVELGPGFPGASGYFQCAP